MNHSLAELLSELSYSQPNDILMFAGDLLAKSTHQGSMSLLDFLVANHFSASNQTQQRIFAVRGNHDQFVVQWRTWRDWFERITIPSSTGNDEAIPTRGSQFLQLIEAEWAIERRRTEADADEWVEVARKRAEGTWREEWWRRIPPPGTGRKEKEWKIFGDHYWLARDMSEEHAAFLLSLPLINYIPSLHFFVVHAGLLPYNPRLPIDDPRQPLTHPPHHRRFPPAEPSADEDEAESDDPEMGFTPMDLQTPLKRAVPPTSSDDDSRTLQELSLLTDIPQNRDPWSLLNMRGVTKKGKVTRVYKGTPWSKLWNRQMRQCSGLRAAATEDEEEAEERSFPCEPSTVVYGHAASRGLDIKRYSMGLDSGCLYGQDLSALVISRSSRKHLDKRRKGKGKHKPVDVKFGDPGMGVEAKVVRVKCTLPPESDEHDH
ncbi:hypothetical protein BXZ70DRAFT_126159 [Cristinia sonorae]|uniref:Calcineurin-like phosphoesterase domain-containing protein n=1 Tax=Cristinia sonorae TaxID=1940300 RepID=A0A8K0UN77_9AGAR|nr:hypothetical protein BXZ70DRAFT_126159 [Cristinia sonorae]